MSHAGRLLVATPLIGDTNFSRAVVALIAHDPDGAFGVVINRPTMTPASDLALVSDVNGAWFDLAVAPSVVFMGGPVATETVIGIVRGTTGSVEVSFPTDDLTVAELGAAPPAEDLAIRFFAGSAGWGPGQLEEELAEGAWWVVEAEPSDVLTPDPSSLWRNVLRRQRGKVAWFANYPDDPTAN